MPQKKISLHIFFNFLSYLKFFCITTMSVFHDEVEIEDFVFDEATETYSYPCPCGDRFLISKVNNRVLILSRCTWARKLQKNSFASLFYFIFIFYILISVFFELSMSICKLLCICMCI